MVDLVTDIVQFVDDFDSSSQSSRNSSTSGDQHATALGSFMESLTRSRRSSVSSAADSDISSMENEIMQKSGIEIIKNMGDRLAVAPAQAPVAPPKEQPEVDSTKFVSGVEEDLNVEEPAASVAE